MAYGRFREAVGESDDITRIIAAVAFLLLLVITLPTFAPSIPGVSNGATCSSLYSPNGNGNNQSILGLNADPTSLHLDLSLQKSVLASGDALMLDVHFINESGGPLVLAFVPDESVFRYDTSENGLMFFIQSTTGAVLGEPASIKPPAPARQQFTPDVLHLLSPHQRCTQTITISANRLAAAGVRQGQYQIIAVYRNSTHGALSAPGALTPTPIFRDQGVFVTTNEGVRSNSVILGVG